MPELPEVETIRRQLAPVVTGRTVVDAWLSPEMPRLPAYPPDGRLLASLLLGRRVLSVDRRGKFLLFPLDDGQTWVVHLRMTGALVHSGDGQADERFLRARFRLDDGTCLYYRDVRKLGRMWVVPDPAQVVGKLGPEPFSEGLSADALLQALRGRRAPLKALLLDQRLVAGLGNIYADEALHEAGLSPWRPGCSLTAAEAHRLCLAIRRVLTRATQDGGTSFWAYLDARGQRGRHQFHVRVYRRQGQPCPRCGTAVARVRLGGRSTHYCPSCQV
ncbi:MAG TPA: bifunctional DNA-formamidopyrimidine glycosylase/DNA-(apurinic or apyrimidinic site) lyase [Dehalococcoidia bacterium]|nr:bifunctional DNA-formamidopyrimidine glycosylase/DNA-(apurinic or apyrimidinic site) lyase [Dehalococcoidia bacterium]